MSDNYIINNDNNGINPDLLVYLQIKYGLI